tara:strand:+ start:58898 stop:60607 length:1710 start_codon:yes stop_codon:yes gene_type:complete
MRVNGNLNVVGLIKNLKVEQLAEDPASPTIGRMWFNTTEGALKYYDGTTIQNVASGGGDLSEFLKLDGSTPMTGDLELSGTDQSASAQTAAISKGHLETALGSKQDTITGAASTVASSDLDTQRIVVTDASGKITATTSATAAEAEYLIGTTSNIQEQLDAKQSDLGYTPVNKAGDSMGGNLAMGGNVVTGLGSPVNANDAARKIDLDNALAGLDFQPDVLDKQVDASLDPGAAPSEGDRYIIEDAAALHANFGTIAGVENNDIVEYDGAEFVVAYDVSVQGQGVLAWNVAIANFQYWTGVSWDDFGGLSGFSAGVGLEKDTESNVVSVLLGAGIGQLPTNEVGVDLRTEGGLMLSEDGVTPSTGTAAQLHVKADDSTVETSASGVRVKASGITEAQLNGSVAGNGLLGGDGTALSVQTPANSGIVVDGTGVSADLAELRNTFLGRDGAEAMTGELRLSSSDQSASAATVAVSKGHLDGALATRDQAVSDVETRLQDGYFVYDGTGAAAASHTVTHNMGNKYVQVQVVDENDEVIIPESITYTDANSLAVTFTQSELCRVIVTGLKAAA